MRFTWRKGTALDSFSSGPRFCGQCGEPLELVESESPMKWDERVLIKKCSSRHVGGGHYWTVVRWWHVGPRFDPMTGEARRDAQVRNYPLPTEPESG